MSRASARIGAIYRKELIDILRDRRTLMAMIVIPVVLYPLLMLGFLRAAESEHERLRAQRFVIEAPDEVTRQTLREIIELVEPASLDDSTESARASEASADAGPGSPASHGRGENGRHGSRPLQQTRASGAESGAGNARLSTSVAETTGTERERETESDGGGLPDDNRPTWEVRVGDTPAGRLGEEVHLRVALDWEPQPSPIPAHLIAEITYNEVDVHSRTAMSELSRIFDRFGALRTREALGDALGARFAGGSNGDSVNLLLNPVDIKTISTATEGQRGGWALGQIIPIILVLMTVTGAIYPAIDLTAGERERGTLETLMAAPVPVIHLIMGKFLVVATVAMITAVLNLASVGATMHFGGITQIIATERSVEFPLHVLPIILVCMVPFALLFSAILVAVCSFARTFKEAQNYVMPVIIAAMIPAFGALLPSTELSGIMMVLPVANMVLLTRELFQQTFEWGQVAIVLLSTSLYAAAAVAVAAKLFGQEVVLFADAGSYKTLLQRRHFRRTLLPSASQALLLAALLFPVSFYTQSLVARVSPDNFVSMLRKLAVVQFAGLFVLVPLAVAVYFRIDVRNTFRLRLPPVRAWVAAVLIGLSSWALAHEFFTLQSHVLSPSEAVRQLNEKLGADLTDSPLWLVVLLLAVVPALSEEFLFRGFVLSGLSTTLRKWPAILATGTIFGVYHFMIERMPVTALLGIMLAYLCWQSRSIFPAMLAHLMHNGLLMVIAKLEIGGVPLAERLGLETTAAGDHLPTGIIVAAVVLFVVGLALAASIRRPEAVTRPSVAGAKPDEPSNG